MDVGTCAVCMYEQMSLPAVARSACSADPCHSYSTALEVVLLLNVCSALALAYPA